MKRFWIALIAIVTACAHAQLPFGTNLPHTLTSTTPSSERWLAGCECSVSTRKTSSKKDEGLQDCRDNSKCFNYEDYADKYFLGFPCTCRDCNDGFDMKCTCDRCVGEFCMEAEQGGEWVDYGDNIWTQRSFFINATTSGTLSASNTVYVGHSFRDDKCQVILDGTTCNSCSDLLTQKGCFELDCSNIDPDYIWTCDDEDDFIQNVAHPMHAVYKSNVYCANEEEATGEVVDRVSYEPEQCLEIFDCEASHQAIIEAWYQGYECSCKKCSSQFDLIDCQVCNSCSEDVCIDLKRGSGWNIPSEGQYVQSYDFQNAVSSGTNSASNRVYAENVFTYEGKVTDYNNRCRVLLDGVECNSCFGLFNPKACFEADCSNVETGAKWSCFDSEAILTTISHPLHGLFTSVSHCKENPGNSNASAIDDPDVSGECQEAC